MAGIFQSLNTARKALWANRMGIDVASHNIANVNTPGFSRQRLHLMTSYPLKTDQGIYGTGVEIAGIERMRNEMLDGQYRDANHRFGKSSVLEQMLYQVETVVQEPSENSIGSLMDDFFTAFSELGGTPDDMNLRNVLLQKTNSLTQAFQTKSTRLRDMRKSIRNEVESAVRQINLISREIADLNQRIGASEVAFTSANDLRDRRDYLLDQLSEFAQIQHSENSNGQVSVTMDGQMLVSDQSARELSVEYDSSNSEMKIYLKGTSSQRLEVKTGKVSGLLEMHNDFIDGVLDRLDTLARTFIEEVNRLHKLGSGLPSGTPPTSSTGLDLLKGASASTISVNGMVADNPANIAASGSGAVGNGDTAFSIANLRNQRFLNGGSETFADFYNFTVTSLGTEVQLANSERANQELLKDQITNQRESESGVSLDEEMTELIKYQRSLEAAARIVSVVDEMLQTVIRM